MNKFKRALALVLTFVMAVSVLTVTPSTTVSAAPSKYVKSLKVNKSKLTIKPGAQAKVKATVKVKGAASTKVKVKLTKANKKVIKSVKVGKPNKKGVSTITFTAKPLTTKKSTTVKVVTASKNSKNKTITKKVKVTVDPTTVDNTTTDEKVAESVTATVAKSTINIGEATVITATVLPADAKDKSVTFTSSNANVASVNNNGVVTGIGEGKATITVKTSNGKIATVDITVVKVEVTGITLDRTSAEIFVSGTTTLIATISPANASSKEVTWASDNTAVATVKDGVVTGVAAGTAKITATSSNGIKAECTVKVSSKTTLADGVTLEVTNPYVDAAGTEYANTTLVGDDMTIQTRVVKNGQPVGNMTVTLSIEALYGNIPDAFTVRTETATTDSNGYANFAIGLKSDYKYDAVSGKYQSLIVTAKESGSNTENAITVKFGSVQLNGISVENGNGIYPAIEPSDNASASDDGLHSTYYLDSTKPEEYVTSQQSSSSQDDHSVYFTASPYLVMPATSENAHIGDWEYNLTAAEGTSGPCSVYNDASNETTTVQVASIPSGLNYINLKFDKISLSKYTTMNIDVYNSLTGANIFHKEVTTKTQDSESIQVQVQEDITSYLVVSLVSQGQVDTSHEGYVLTKLVGNWASENNELTSVEEINGSVKWSDVSDKVTYEATEWTYDAAKEYLPTDSTFLKDTYQYTYKVPAYPYTGDAIIVVKDANDNLLANFLYPTENNGKNVNVLAASSTSVKAVQASDEEITNKVGTLTTDGNMAIVNSTKSGSKALKAEITVAGLDDKELNSQNGGVLYTSVQFAPVPKKDEVVVIPDYFAIEGQNVVVTAQLFDENGNKKTDSGKKVTFKVKDNEVNLSGTTVGDRATLADVSNDGSTDTTGTVKLTIRDLTNNDYYSLVENLTAEAEGYTVKLSVGGESYVEAADIYWVDLGITFVNSAVDSDNQKRTTQFENSAMAVADTAEYVVSNSNGWQIGYQVVARSSKFRRPFYDTTAFTQAELPTYLTEAFIDISGVSVVYEKDSENVTMTQKNSVATMNSTTATTAVLTGNLKVDNSSAVKFTFYDEDGNKVTYKNIGEGTPNVEQTGLKLTTEWKTTGTNVKLVAPKNVYNQTAATVYVVVTDDYDNAIANANVTYSITGVNATTGSGTTDNKGVLAISLPATTVSSVAVAVVSVKVNDSVSESVNINYTPADSSISKFALRTETDTSYAVTIGSDKKTINVYFSNAVSEDTIKAGQFTFVQDGSTDNTYKVVSAVKGSESNCVVLTLDKAIASEGANHKLKIASYTDTLGVKYTLMDTYGQVFSDTSYAIVPNAR